MKQPPSTTDRSPLLKLCELTVEYAGGRRRPALRAVDEVTLAVAARETVGLVGESGSGKTTIGRAILGLAPVKSGSVSFAGEDITHASYQDRRRLSADMQVVFQDPYSSLNPTRTIGQTVAEPLRVHGKLARAEVAERVRAMLERVGLPPEAANRFPSNFSGGQRQRIVIARAFIVQPRLVVCDEPVSSLDLSVQAQVLNLLHELQDERDLSYLFIGHDLAVVRHLAHRLVVLYRGRIMEQGAAATVYNTPKHPYTQTLFNASPIPNPGLQRRRRAARERFTPDARVPPTADGCPFAPRCAYAIGLCRSVRPHLESADNGSLVACHRWQVIPAYPFSEAIRTESSPTMKKRLADP